jgi:hypothetical protein
MDGRSYVKLLRADAIGAVSSSPVAREQQSRQIAMRQRKDDRFVFMSFIGY